MPTFDSDKAMIVLGVPGRLTHRTTKPDATNPAVWFKQRWISEQRSADDYEKGAVIVAEMRFDDELGNGHNSFAITGNIYGLARRLKGHYSRDLIAGGCLHEEIAKAFPELTPLLKWHLTSSDEPMHYIANTIYHAGDRDHHGVRAGEPWSWERAIRFGSNPIKHRFRRGSFVKFLEESRGHPPSARFDFEVIGLDHDDRKTYGTKYTFGGYADKWHECPFDNEADALEFLYALQHCDPHFIKIPCAWGEGKKRELDHARSSAVWPDAPDEILTSEPDVLRKALEDRHPALMAEFRATMESTGFLWSPESISETEG